MSRSEESDMGAVLLVHLFSRTREAHVHHQGTSSRTQRLSLLRRMLSYDRRLEPRVGERVPYVVVYGTPGVPLIQLVRRPLDVLQDPTLRLNATYYITKQILPPLARMFQLIGVDVFSWYQELPRVRSQQDTGGLLSFPLRSIEGWRSRSLGHCCPLLEELPNALQQFLFLTVLHHRPMNINIFL